ncbi:MAG: PDZ domain-containing protein [Cyclobacteriaceae bacterium]|nr:PDZ domain-containing protein [Cyclobacteriaceae bacterium]
MHVEWVKLKGIRSVVSFLVGFLLVLSSCNKDEPAHPNAYVNNWIYNNMDFWYYWNSTLPTSPDKTLEHEAFFESLLNSNDRFSWIQDNFKELQNSLQGISKEAGYELVLYRESADNSNVIAQIVYVKPNSPATHADLHRGDVITKINSQQLTLTNYQALLNAISENHSITYRPFNLTTEEFDAEQTTALTTIEYAENPNFLSKVFSYNDRKIGYYVYNFFATGPSQTSNQYNTEMDEIFAGFQSAGITDLIIDLRFNSGGAETATTNLASLIGKEINATKVFTIREYNEKVTAEIKKEPTLGEDFLTIEFINKSQNVGGLLRDNRVYILTGTRSASASELLINGLRPYMDVFLIGNKTAGKNVGSITLNEDNDPNNLWGMQPIVTKSFNSLKQSDYDTGFNPQIFLEDNSFILYPLGDPRERLLNNALREITGLTEFGRIRSTESHGAEVGNSLDLKLRTNVLVIDPTVEISLHKILR